MTEPKPELKLMPVKAVQPSNISYVFVTAEVSKPVRSRLVITFACLNIWYILVTAEVLSPDKSTLVSKKHPLNAYSIVVTAEVSDVP